MSKFHLTIDSSELAVQIANLINSGGQLRIKLTPYGILRSGIEYVIETYGEKVAGVIGLEKQHPKVTELKHLCVAPDFRRKGIGRKLLEKGILASKTTFVYGTVRSDNLVNIRNNLRIGMRPIGYKMGHGCHIIIFARRRDGIYRRKSS